ncbi:DUF4270 domain-containing protein [uncultured Winogradskyella sp.]|uniref:DUF4270 domain-containing protein n=1 Tax=uncultured Winogradskyella sp. TaxID=395353 RepID=UPI0026199D50|nr:DUF4270 domain-containing protein [uncultured Winogradskyella sp.]
MKKNKFVLNILVLSLILSSFIACDKDFATLDSDIINDDIATSFDILNDTYDIISYTKPLGPVQTNSLGINTLGIYNDSYGKVTSSFVVQPVLSVFEPEFGEEIEVDSVVLTLPYQFSVTDIDDEGNITYDIDSVIGREPIKLSIFESNYFIRDFDPNDEFGTSQAYFSNKSASATETISEASLEGEELVILQNPLEVNHITLDDEGNVTINEEGFILLGEEPEDEDEEQVITRQAPGIRLKLDTAYWEDKIISQEGETVLSSINNFSEYFRGLYFKAEANDLDDGSFLIINAGNTTPNIVIYYSRLISDEGEDPVRENTSFAINLIGNGINFLNNDFTSPIAEGDPDTGDSRLYLKGGEGSIANIKLFNGDDIDNDDDDTFDDWKNTFVETTSDGKFIRSKRLVNEANLVFYVDQDMVQGGEPDRIYLYDVDNKVPLIDYFLDGVNNSLPLSSVSNHLGPLQRVDDEPDGDGIKYKLRITQHINNLLIRDSTNVELGLAVSLNVNIEGSGIQRQVQSMEDIDFTVPSSSVLTPRGTVLHGNNTEDESKRVYLEIYYTEPND